MPRGGANFTAKELAVVLSHYDIGIIQQINSLTAGNRRAPKKIIISDHGKYLLKRRAAGKDDRYRVAFAHTIHVHFSEKSFPVSRLIPTKDENNTILQLDNHIYELFEFIPGTRYDGTAEAVQDAGRCLAIFHNNVRDFECTWTPLRNSFHDSSSVRGYLKKIGSEKENHSDKDMRRTAEALMVHYNESAVNVNQLGFDSWSEQIIHGDWHPGNMLFAASKVVGVLDFDSLKIAPAVTDLANGMLQFSLVGGRPNPADWPDYLDQAKLVSFIKGYCAITVPVQDCMDALADMMIETMIAEAVLPIAATGSFGNLSGSIFLKMIHRKCDWIETHRNSLSDAIMCSVQDLIK